MDLTGIDFNVLTHEPKVFVISGPSGIGKDTVVQLLKKRNHPFHFDVTVHLSTFLQRPIAILHQKYI